MNQKPNIIFLVLDTLRTERMSIYGYDRPTTPTLESLADDSTIFDWAVAPAPWTVPSHASMFTGLYPTVHQTNQSYASLPQGIPSLAELLRDNGYETVAFCNNPLVSCSTTASTGVSISFSTTVEPSPTSPALAMPVLPDNAESMSW